MRKTMKRSYSRKSCNECTNNDTIKGKDNVNDITSAPVDALTDTPVGPLTGATHGAINSPSFGPSVGPVNGASVGALTDTLIDTSTGVTSLTPPSLLCWNRFRRWNQGTPKIGSENRKRSMSGSGGSGGSGGGRIGSESGGGGVGSVGSVGGGNGRGSVDSSGNGNNEIVFDYFANTQKENRIKTHNKQFANYQRVSFCGESPRYEYHQWLIL